MVEDPLGLRQLPARRAPEALWTSIARRLDEGLGEGLVDEPARNGGSGHAGPAITKPSAALAIAAAIAIATGVTLVVDQRSTRNADGAGDSISAASPSRLATVRDLSAVLEARLARTRDAVVNPQELQALLWIESELRLTDELIADNPDSIELWTQRTRLLDEINARRGRGHWPGRMQLTHL